MEEIIKQDQDKDTSHKEFKKLLSEDLNNRKFKEGELTTAIISEIGKKYIFVDNNFELNKGANINNKLSI